MLHLGALAMRTLGKKTKKKAFFVKKKYKSNLKSMEITKKKIFYLKIQTNKK